MMTHSLSKELVGKLLPDESVTVFLVGYQDPDTPGSWLKEGKSYNHHRRPTDRGAGEGSVVRLLLRTRRQPGHRRLAGQDSP